MKEDKLKELLDKYYDGNSSPEEEQELKDFFSGDVIFPGYDAEKEIFRYYSSSEQIPVPSTDFDNRILNTIDKLEVIKRKNIFRKGYITILSAAATILIMIAAWFITTYDREPEDTFSDPVIAYAETMKILNNVSVKLNRGTKAIKPVFKLVNTTRDGIKSIDRSFSLISGGLKKAGITISFDDESKKSDEKPDNK
ncbi:MAG TPA: hypothetical protein DDW27_12360 [Bacteroidales bacterium]|nr:hypothetical protein [Bacteroidales bacterium]